MILQIFTRGLGFYRVGLIWNIQCRCVRRHERYRFLRQRWTAVVSDPVVSEELNLCWSRVLDWDPELCFHAHLIYVQNQNITKQYGSKSENHHFWRSWQKKAMKWKLYPLGQPLWLFILNIMNDLRFRIIQSHNFIMIVWNLFSICIYIFFFFFKRVILLFSKHALNWSEVKVKVFVSNKSWTFYSSKNPSHQISVFRIISEGSCDPEG